MTLPNHLQIELPLLRELVDAGGQARPSELYPRMRRHFPQIEEADLGLKLSSTGGSLWHNRIQWARQHLVIKGDMYREPRGIWRITQQGRERVDSQAHSITSAPTRATDPATPTVVSPQPAVKLITNELEALCERLERTQRLSSSPKLFEGALAEAFRFLDFDVRELGKSGETDLILQSHVGADSYRVVVDAKATHGDKIAEGQIHWLAIKQHQRGAGADHAAVVGIDFRGGNLTKWATEHDVALIRTSELITIIRMYRATPFSLKELRTLFMRPGLESQRLRDLELIHQAGIRHWKLLVEVIRQIADYNRFNAAGLIATADGVQLMLYGGVAGRSQGMIDPASVPTKEEVRDAMAFLSTRAVGILKEGPPESGQYHLTMHAEGALRRIEALAYELQSAALKDEGPSNENRVAVLRDIDSR